MRVITSLILLTACVAFAGVSFGINPLGSIPQLGVGGIMDAYYGDIEGLEVNMKGSVPETYIGYRIGPVVPYLSLNLYHAGFVFEYRDEDFPENNYTAEGGGSIFAPVIGTKFIFGPSELKPFVRVSAGMPFLLSLNLEVSDPDVQEDIDTVLTQIKEGTDTPLFLVGGAGVEYYLSDRFSVGGEFNYRLLKAGGEWEFWEDEFVEASGRIGSTSAGLWLNYYF
jgi:hypothetical protein